ncbi:hypothetical protein PIB30_057002 [Stylosanthes scabra]|uniref:Uncharacterized protein n=1 Tax=Stylosanthes scabra TaxID=79078 RepID=A0ABU6WI22_9FABA|nr:hypothetical protein [Stylosanthes scabra]
MLHEEAGGMRLQVDVGHNQLVPSSSLGIKNGIIQLLWDGRDRWIIGPSYSFPSYNLEDAIHIKNYSRCSIYKIIINIRGRELIINPKMATHSVLRNGDSLPSQEYMRLVGGREVRVELPHHGNVDRMERMVHETLAKLSDSITP